MELDASKIIELLGAVSWEENSRLRLFWVKIPHGSRDAIAQELRQANCHNVVIPLVLRETLFLTANSVMADFSRLLESNRVHFEETPVPSGAKITVIILLKENFKISQISSPVTLPRWFPLLGGAETYLHVSDLLWCSEVELLNCEDAQIDHMSTWLYDLEKNIVDRLRQLSKINDRKIRSLIDSILELPGSTDEVLTKFETTLANIPDKKGYRPNSTNKNSIISIIFSQVLRSAPDKLSTLATKFSEAVDDKCDVILKPTLFTIMLRPAPNLPQPTKNWHSILLAAFQVYQLMNASAHAGEYPKYPVSLVSANSRDLLNFLAIATQHLSLIHAETEMAS